MVNSSLKLVILSVLIFSVAAANAAPPLADARVDASALQLTPVVSNHSLKLVVTGPDSFYFEETFAPSGLILFSIDAGLADGIYDYELVRVLPPRLASEAELVALAEAPKQSGSFTVRGGAGVDSSLVELPPTKDIVYSDDVIIDSNLCVGFDCVDGEVFESDVLRLKDVQLRLHFEDPSIGTFPSNDWRLVANDLTSGGANYFAIEDATAEELIFRVDAGAPANALRIDSTGEVGLGTSTPVADLHIVSGDTPTLRFEQDNSLGQTAQTFEIATDEDSFSVNDVTDSKTPFSIEAGADDHALFIEADNHVGLGTNDPRVDLHILKSGSPVNPLTSKVAAMLQNNGSVADGVLLSLVSGTMGNAQVIMGDADSTTQGRVVYRNTSDVMSFYANGDERMRIGSDGGVCIDCNESTIGADFSVGDPDGANTVIDAGSLPVTSSSRTLKENLEAIDSGDILSKISEIEVYRYDFIDGDKNRLGLMAEDFHQVFERGSDKTIAAQEVQMAMWLAIQELTARVKELEAELEK